MMLQYVFTFIYLYGLYMFLFGQFSSKNQVRVNKQVDVNTWTLFEGL